MNINPAIQTCTMASLQKCTERSMHYDPTGGEAIISWDLVITPDRLQMEHQASAQLGPFSIFKSLLPLQVHRQLGKANREMLPSQHPVN